MQSGFTRRSTSGFGDNLRPQINDARRHGRSDHCGRISSDFRKSRRRLMQRQQRLRDSPIQHGKAWGMRCRHGPRRDKPQAQRRSKTTPRETARSGHARQQTTFLSRSHNHC